MRNIRRAIEVCFILLLAWIILLSVWVVAKPEPENVPKEEVSYKEEESITMAMKVEITHMNCDMRETSVMLPYFLISVRDPEKNFGASFMIDGDTYAKYKVGEIVTIKPKGHSYEIVG